MTVFSISPVEKTDASACTYLLLVSPPASERNRVTQLKRQVARLYHSGIALSLPHITIAQFFAWERNEKTIVQSLCATAATYRPIDIQLVNFGQFPKHTVYIRVESAHMLDDLSRDLKAAISTILIRHIPGRKPHFPGKMHMTIVRKLDHGHWFRAVRIFRRLRFSARFAANGMTLLKWIPDKGAYRFVADIPFSGNRFRLVQLSLF